MLYSFSVSNFKSFNTEQCMSMSAGKTRNNIDRVYMAHNNKLLKFLAIYGANASGKSSLVDAMGFAQEVIIKGIPIGCNNDYCRTDEENRNKPSSFTFVITIGSQKYEYGFDIILSSTRITAEYLYEITKTSLRKIIFRRDIDNGTYEIGAYFKNNDAVSRLQIYAEDICLDGSILLLYQMNSNKGTLYSMFPEFEVYRKVYEWFKYQLSVNHPDSPVTNYPYIFYEDNVAKISALLDAFDTGIEEFRIVEVPIEKVSSKIPKDLYEHIIEHLSEQSKDIDKINSEHQPSVMLRSADNSMYFIQYNGHEYICKTIEFSHRSNNNVFSLSDESDGTIRLLDLIEVLICSEEECVYVIDEINRRLHPLLTRRFVEEYLKLANSRNIQLIVTTHEAELMSFDLLRKDEIAFVSKDDIGHSHFYSMDSFDARFDKKVRNAYLQGDYGAIPFFASI